MGNGSQVNVIADGSESPLGVSSDVKPAVPSARPVILVARNTLHCWEAFLRNLLSAVFPTHVQAWEPQRWKFLAAEKNPEVCVFYCLPRSNWRRVIASTCVVSIQLCGEPYSMVSQPSDILIDVKH
eukprot:RCo005092